MDNKYSMSKTGSIWNRSCDGITEKCETDVASVILNEIQAMKGMVGI